MPGTFQNGDNRPVHLPVATASAFEAGDMVCRESDGTGTRMSSQTWTTDLATTRAAAVLKFAGHAEQGKDANKPVLGNGTAKAFELQISTGGRVLMPVSAGTYIKGDLLGPAKAAGNALLDQQLEKVGSLAQATHRAVGRVGTNPGSVEAEILSVLFADART